MHYLPLSLKRAIPLTLIATSVLLASGCSSSSSDSKDNSTQDNKVAITGTAAKGILSGALVEACVLADCKGDKDPIASATTDDKGNYSLSVAADQPMTLVLRVRYQEGAQMTCDVPTGCETNTAFGAKFPMPTELALRSVTSVEKSATTVSAHITPITELVTAAAVESRSGLGTLSVEAVTNGSDAVRKLLGLSEGSLLTQIKPVDVTSNEATTVSDDDLQISLLAAAFADTDSAKTIARIKEMAGAVSGKPASKTTLESLADGAKAALTAAALKTPALNSKKAALDTALDTTKTNATASCGATTICEVKPKESQLSNEEVTGFSNNIKTVKSLVEDVRTLGWEVIPKLEDTLDNTNSIYDENNLFAQIDEAKTLFDKGNGVTANGSGAIASDALVAVAERLVDGYTKCKTECPTNLTGIDTDLDTAEGITWTNDNLSKTGNTWSVTEAKYSITGQSSATVSMSITFPVITDLDVDSFGELTGTLDKNASLKISAKSVAGDASIELTEGTLTAVLSDNLDLAAYDAEVTIESLTFKVTDAIISNSIVTFTGNLTLEAGTSAKQKGINPNSADAVLPKSINLKGVFAGAGAESLEAELNFNFDSFDNFSYHVNGQYIDGLLTFSQEDDGKTLIAVLGADGNKATIRIEYEDSEHDGPRLKIKCSPEGKVWCHGQAYFNPINAWSFNEQNEWQSIEYTGPKKVIDAIDFMLTNNHGSQASHFFNMDVEHPQYGWLQVPEDLTTLQITSNSARAFADDVRESDSDHVLFTTSAKVKGKLSANLPEMAIGLEVRRTARFAASAKLTLDWDSDTNKKQLVLSASSVGTSEQSMEDNIVLKVSDKVGTSLDLVLIDRISPTDTVVGTISKDGTKYATITEEGSNMFFVTYHYDDEGNKANSTKMQFESLF